MLTISVGALVVIAAYLWGSIPSGYLVGRYRKGIDIRSYGSGNTGATNLMAHVGNWTGFGLGVFDCLVKGSLPVVSANLLGMSMGIQVAAGLAAVAGHNWSAYSGLTGGRGVATSIGVILGFFLWKEMLILVLVMGLAGRIIFHETGLWTLVSIAVLPVLVTVFGQPVEVFYMTLGIATLIILKRLTANGENPREGPGLGRVLVCRLIWDRDLPRKSAWLGRRPAAGE